MKTQALIDTATAAEIHAPSLRFSAFPPSPLMLRRSGRRI